MPLYMMKRTSYNSDSWVKRDRHKSIFKNVAAGLFSGICATGFMTLFQSKLDPNIKKRVSRLDRVAPRSPEPEVHRNAPKEDPSTVKVASMIYRQLMGRELSEKYHYRAGQMVHFSFGATQGVNYALISTLIRKSGPVSGILFGMGVWLFADETLLPLLGVAKSPRHYPIYTHAYGFLAHLVYGASLGTIMSMCKSTIHQLSVQQPGRSKVENPLRLAS
jgi:uncharacterized membrane protein YagU involved in acid resistance